MIVSDGAMPKTVDSFRFIGGITKRTIRNWISMERPRPITGCCHPTLEKLVSRAKALYGKPVVGVVGGLHYGAASQEDLQPQTQFLATRQPGLVALSPHDRGPEVLDVLQTAFPEAYQFGRVGKQSNSHR
jgi:hypothetical protein